MPFLLALTTVLYGISYNILVISSIQSHIIIASVVRIIPVVSYHHYYYASSARITTRFASSQPFPAKSRLQRRVQLALVLAHRPTGKTIRPVDDREREGSMERFFLLLRFVTFLRVELE
jgi:hypothetical protein